MDNNVQSILKFNLDTQEGRDAHFRACKADMAYRAIHEIQQEMRRLDKYVDKEECNIHELRNKITDIIIENGIDLDEEYR